MSGVRWVFPDQKSGLTDYHEIPTEQALDSDLETFVREVLQNANDQALPGDDPVEVTFDFRRLTGDLDRYLRALHWTGRPDDEANLRWHVERAVENEQARDPGLKRFLEQFDREELLVLTVHDENTTGLRGDENDGSNPYGALVKDFGGSEKPESSSGGSYGLGKTVLWAFSSVSSVVFNSVPHDDGGDDHRSRLVGRSILPAHEHDDPNKSFTSHGWFGADDDHEIDRLGRPPSVWDDSGGRSGLATDLHVARPSDAPGTSIGVVGFRIPGEELCPDPSELADRIGHAAMKYFWPAISRGDLKVHVRTPGEGRTEVGVDDAPAVEPFVRCYDRLFNTDTDELNGPGTVARTDVELTVPAEDDTVVESPDPAYESACDVVVRQLSPGDKERLHESDDDDVGANCVARLRGAQMIVDYLDKSSVADRGVEFAAVVVGGEAQSPPGTDPTPEQEAVERFLKRSEPTQHDDWQGRKNDYLKKFYTGTIVKEVTALKGDRLDAVLAEVVHEEVESGDEVPGMDDVAPVMDGYSPDGNGGGSPMRWRSRPESWFEGDRWYFSASGGPDVEDHGPWQLTVELERLDAEESAGTAIPVESIDPRSDDTRVEDTADGRRLHVDETVDEVEFVGYSEPVVDDFDDVGEAFELGALTRARVVVSAEIEEGE